LLFAVDQTEKEKEDEEESGFSSEDEEVEDGNDIGTVF
jgi:hypothetical protein